MSNIDSELTTSAALHSEAERRLLERQSVQAALPSEAEVRAMIHELQVHQIELEMQNQELMRTKAIAEEASRRYTDLFDFAPIGYFVWDARAKIQELNLAGAALLGMDRCAAIDKRFGQFVSEEDRPHFNELCQRASTTELKQSLEVRLQLGERQFEVLIETQAHSKGVLEQILYLATVVDISERKRLERLMRLTQFSIDHAVDSVFWIGADAEIIYVNEAACRTLGYTREEIVGKTVPSIDPNFPAEAWPAHWEEIRQRKSFSFESDHYTKTGELIHTEVTVNYLVFEGKEYNCAMMRNITERKKAEIQMSRLAAIVTSSDDAIISKTLDGIITSWNESATRLFGYSEAQMIGAPITLLFPPDRLEEEANILRRIQLGKRVEQLETVRIKQDGTPVHVSVTISPIKNAMGQVIGASKSVRDITERKRAQDALRDSEQRYRTFIETCADSVYLLDTTGNIRTANHAATQMHGYTLDELQAMNIRDLNDPTNALKVPDRLSRILGGESLQFETVHRRKDGTSFPTEVRATLVSIGNEVLILAFDRDISERKRREEQTNLLREELAYTSRLVTLREMASGLAHELNQPLTSLGLYIGSAIELAAQYNSTNLNECMRRIAEQLQHSGEIIRSMRAFAGRGPSRRENININLLINDVMHLLAGELNKSDTVTTLDLNAQMCQVLTSGIQVKQVLVNLIRNALEALNACEACERKVVIRTELLQNEVRVSVTDTGPGLDSEIAKRLFLPFQTTKPEGLGMGLAICRTLIEALGGRIGVRSPPAGGTTFHFELPRIMDPLPT